MNKKEFLDIVKESKYLLKDNLLILTRKIMKLIL